MNYEEILERMEERYRELTGFSADGASDIGIRLKVLAKEVSVLYGELASLQEQVFPQTSTGEWLELHAQTRGITRKPALQATGILRFSRETAAGGDILIPQGTLCAARGEEQIHFETTESGVLPAGELWAEVPSRAVEAGTLGNAAPGAVCLMVTAASGISAVANPEAFGGGVDAESDRGLRERLLESYENISNSTNRAFYYDLTMQNEGVASANILPRRRGRGTVDVVIAGHAEALEPELLAALEEELGRRKEINVDLRVLAAGRDLVDLSAEVAVRDGYSYETVAQACQKALEDTLNSMAVGEPLLLAQAGSALFGVDGVYNYAIVTPARDYFTEEDRVVRAGTVSVGRMAVS